MSERDFCYWLQGFVEVYGHTPTEEQWKIIKDHLALVFNKVTPKYEKLNLTPNICAQPEIKSGQLLHTC